MRLRHQALITLVCVGCVCSGGCARLLQTFLSPQQAAMDTAGRVANSATAPAQQDVAGMGREVDRLLAGNAANQAELQKVKQELERRQESYGRGASAQGEAERLRPWHPRAPAPDVAQSFRQTGDNLRMGRARPERGLPAPGRLPDGIAGGELQSPLDLTPRRLKRPN